MVSKTVLLSIAAITFANPIPPEQQYSVQLPWGRYHGLHDPETSVTVYYAVPYAQAKRFEAPRPIDTVDGLDPDKEVNATAHGAACPNFKLSPPFDQAFEAFLGPYPAEPQSEDCLNLDVYVPDGNHDDLPVLFFAPGGGFLVGASWPTDMRSLVSRSAEMGKPFIGVAIQYRLGPLGTLNPSTAKDVNVGVLDQFEALRFINKYAGVWGGSGKKVTIMGQSAGAESTLYQLLWNDEHLFRAAYMLSVPSSGAPFLRTTPNNKDDLIQSFAAACGCPGNQTIDATVDCLRTMNVDTMIEQSVAWEGSGVSLGGAIKENSFRTIRAGKYPKIPMVVSICRDEGTSQALPFNASTDEITIAAGIQGLLVPDRFPTPESAESFTSSFLAAYPPDPAAGAPFTNSPDTFGQPEQYKRLAAITTDSIYVEAWTEYLHTFSRDPNTKIWGILFEEPIPGAPPELGVQHASDLVFYFPTLLGEEADPRTHGAGDLVERVQAALVRFVAEGDPNAGETEGLWPRFEEGKKEKVVALDRAGVREVDLPRRKGLELLREGLRPEGL